MRAEMKIIVVFSSIIICFFGGSIFSPKFLLFAEGAAAVPIGSKSSSTVGGLKGYGHAYRRGSQYLQNHPLTARSLKRIGSIDVEKCNSFANRIRLFAEECALSHLIKNSKIEVASSGVSVTTTEATKRVSSISSNIARVSSTITTIFPIWALFAAILAITRPQSFVAVRPEHFSRWLGVLMLSMGLTLTPEALLQAAQQPKAVLLSLSMCFGLAPLLAVLLGRLFSLPDDIVAGMGLVGAINGAQSSNICAYIMNGDVALSVILTVASTVSGVVMTPLLCRVLLQSVVNVDSASVVKSIATTVMIPITLGFILKGLFPRAVAAVLPVAPILALAVSLSLMGASMADCASSIISGLKPVLKSLEGAAGAISEGVSTPRAAHFSPWKLQVAFAIFHSLSGVFGYYIPKVLGLNEIQSRTLAIETAMKSSAFAYFLAVKHFDSYYVRVPSAVSLFWMTAVGATMASIWKFLPVPCNNQNIATQRS